MPRDLAILACTECKRRNYTSTRNKKTMTERVEKAKFCPFCRKHTILHGPAPSQTPVWTSAMNF